MILVHSSSSFSSETALSEEILDFLRKTMMIFGGRRGKLMEVLVIHCLCLKKSIIVAVLLPHHTNYTVEGWQSLIIETTKK